MSIGETLARARRDAGMSIGDISRRTRIRLSVVDDIEHDNYSSCGGDHRARGNIAAIARAVGVDSAPLIEAYYAARRPAGWIAATRASEATGSEQATEVSTPGQGPEPVTVGEDTEPITISQASEPITAGEPPHLLTIGESPYPIAPAQPAIPGRVSGPEWLAFADRRLLFWIALGGALLAVAALGGILLIVGASGQPPRQSVVAGPPRSRGTAHPARTGPQSGHSATSPGTRRPASRGGSRAAKALAPASIAAFGPGGTGHGDSPQLAHQALAGKAAAPWRSAWYTTPHFGNLQSGTGLLLNMGRTVTITSVRIALGNRAGTDLALRIGNSPTLAGLRPVAAANDAGSVVRLKTAPTRGRYVLVWFTKLPPDQAGTFQVSVYDIKLHGYR